MDFSEIPADNLVPIFSTQIDNSTAVKGGAMPWKNLLIGQSTVSTYNGSLVKVRSDDQADAAFGQGSQLALMCKAFRKNSTSSELWALPIANPSEGSAASGAIAVTVSGSSGLEKAGVVRLMIGGQTVNVNVAALDTATNVATKIAAAINGNGNLPVTATSSTSTVTVTAKNKGTCGECIDIRYNHYQGQELPEGMSLSITAMSGAGSDTEYTDSNVKNIIKGTWFNAIVCGSDDEDNVNYLRNLLDNRWTATMQQTGVCFRAVNYKAFPASSSDSDPCCEAEGSKYNSQVVVVPALPKSPTPNWEIASATVAAIAPHAQSKPAEPLMNYQVRGVIAPKEEDRLDFDDNNTLMHAGCAYLKSSADGAVYLGRIITTYRLTPNGAQDKSYQQVETVFTLSYLRWDWNNHLSLSYPHSSLADDGNEFGPGVTVMTPSLGKGELLGKYKNDWMAKGLVQNFESFKENVVVMRDPDDNTALQFLIPAELVSQFFVGKSLLQFKI